MKTAKEFLEDIVNEFTRESDFLDTIEEGMKEFAKMHVQAALKAASEESNLEVDCDNYGITYPNNYEFYTESRGHGGMIDFMTSIGIDKSSILKSYPLENII